MKSKTKFEIHLVFITDGGVSWDWAFEKKSPYTYNRRNVVATLAPSFLIASTSFLQVTQTCIKTWMSLNFVRIRQLTTELAQP